MSNINKAAVLNPFTDLTANILDYVPRATTSEFGIVAIGSGINVDNLGRIYLDTQEYSDRLAAIEAQAASSLSTQQTEVAAAIAQVNLTQSQTITALTLEVDNLKTDLTNSITATQTDLINRADQLAQDVTDITDQLTQDKAAFTQEIQDALVYLENAESVASALRTPRKIQGVDFDGTQDISLPVFTTQIDGLVPKRVGATSTKYLCEDGTWVIPTNTTYTLLTKAIAEVGTATTANTISAQVLKDAIKYHAPPVTNITGNAGTATKLQTPRTINGISFDGTQDISLPEAVAYSLPTASASVLGGIKVGSGLTISNSVLSVGTLNQSTTGNAATATKLQTARTISLTGNVTGSVSFDGSANASITTAITELGVANGIATLDSSGQVPSTQLPSYVDDVLEYLNAAAFPATGESGKIYVETTGNTTYRWSGTGYVKITSGEVASVAGKTGVVTLTKSDVGLSNVDNTADSSKSVASAAKLTTARAINGVSFDGTANITVPIKTIRTTAIETDDLSESVFFRSDAGAGTIGIHIQNPVDSRWAYQLSQDSSYNSIGLKVRVKSGGTWSGYKSLAFTDSDITGNAASATKLQTVRTLSWTGDATGSLSFNGTANAASALTLANSGVTAGTYKSVTVDAKGRVTAGTAVVTGLVTATAASGTANTATTNTNTFLNIVETVGTTPSTVGTSTQITGAGTVTVTSDTAGKLTITGSQSITGNAATATKLATARTINGVAFDGTANIEIPLETPNATETVAGKAKIATTAIAQAGTNDTDVITPLKLKNSVFGIGQTVQNVTTSRALATTYTNSTGKPILISLTVAGTNDNKTTTLTVDGVVAASVSNSSQYGQAKSICYVIPPSSTYSVVGSPITLWTELR